MENSGCKWLKFMLSYICKKETGMYGGTYFHQIDDKGRLRIPSKLKATLGEKPTIMQGSDGCLIVLSEEESNRLAEKLRQVPMSDTKAQQSLRRITSSMYFVEEDKQGRFVLPQHLRKYANIEKNVVFIGVANRVELWGEEHWNEYLKQEDMSSNDIFGGLLEYGV